MPALGRPCTPAQTIIGAADVGTGGVRRVSVGLDVTMSPNAVKSLLKPLTALKAKAGKLITKATKPLVKAVDKVASSVENAANGVSRAAAPLTKSVGALGEMWEGLGSAPELVSAVLLDGWDW
jgi:hypothetical protein